MSRQQIVAKSWRFYRLPLAVFSALLFTLAYEVLRTNLAASGIQMRPVIFGVGPTLTAAVAVGGLIAAREQYARANRPMLGGASAGWTKRGDRLLWEIRIFNGGPGYCFFLSVSYTAHLRQGGPSPAPMSATDLRDALRREGLRDGDHFEVRRIDAGAPLPPLKSSDDGLALFAFSPAAVSVFAELQVDVLVEGLLGDKYLWSRDLMEVAPSPP